MQIVTKIKQAARWVDDKHLRWLVPLVIMALVLFAPAVSQQITEGGANGDAATTDAAEYQEQLRSQVDTETGAPEAGRDPASQPQASLSAAASDPSSAGYNGTNPASGVQGSTGNGASASDVYGDPQSSGIGSNGCFIDYGIQGEQCVPSHAATDGKLTCSGVKGHGFPNGVKVSGTDRFTLDTNKDGIACNSGDA